MCYSPWFLEPRTLLLYQYFFELRQHGEWRVSLGCIGLCWCFVSLLEPYTLRWLRLDVFGLPRNLSVLAVCYWDIGPRFDFADTRRL